MSWLPDLNRSCLLPLILVSAAAYAGQDPARHQLHQHGDRFAPIGIMGDHVMSEGEWMLSLRHMNMDMDGNRSGTDRVPAPLAGYMVSPLRMNMDMTMLGAMYGIDDDVTVMLMLPYLSNDMDHVVNMNGVNFTTEASGVGDARLTVALRLHDGLIMSAGISLPTGSIDERDVTPASSPNTVRLPYPMQPGSGTWDLLLGATMSGHAGELDWGVQGTATLRTGDNDNSYRLGNAVDVNAWLVKPFTANLSGTARLSARDQGNIDGADPALNPMMVPTADPALRGGTRVEALLGVNATFGEHTLGLEIGVPVHQDLDGPQLETDRRITIGWITVY